MKRANNDCEVKYHIHYENFTAPEMNKKKQAEQYENQKIEHRLKSLADAQDRQRQMKHELTQVHHQAIERQLISKNEYKYNQQREKEIQKQKMEAQTEMLRNRD